jgi:L-ribulokinase
MFATVAAGEANGGYRSIFEAAQHMARLKDDVYRPIAANKAVYDRLYAEYSRLHDYLGRGENDVIKLLRRIREEALVS